MNRKLLSLLLAAALALSLLPAAAFATGPAVDTEQSSYEAGDMVNVLLTADCDLMIEVFQGDALDGIKVISSATSGNTYSFRTGPGWSEGTYTVVVGAGSDSASCMFYLTASDGETPAPCVYIRVADPQGTVFINITEYELTAGMTAMDLLLLTGLNVEISDASDYVEAIENLAEGGEGEGSGWLYRVNGVFLGVSASDCTLYDGDYVEWLYTRDYGEDLGAYYLTEEDEEEIEGVISADASGTAVIGADDLGDLADAGSALTIKADAATVVFNADGTAALAGRLGSGQNLAVAITETDPSSGSFKIVSGDDVIAALDISITAGATEIKDGFGAMAVSVAVGTAYAGQTLSILHFKDNGEYEILTGTVDSSGSLTFEVTSLSTFVILEQANVPVEYIYIDVDADEWYTEYVQYVYSEGIMSGVSDTAFEPKTVMSRAMLVTVLYRMAGEPDVAGTGGFGDVECDSWYCDAVTWAAGNEIAEGYGGGLFGPGDEVTREQLATFFWRYARYAGLDVGTGENTDITSYEDAGEISPWAAPAFRWAVGRGIVAGTSARELSPDLNSLRCEAAAVITRLAGVNAA